MRVVMRVLRRLSVVFMVVPAVLVMHMPMLIHALVMLVLCACCATALCE